MLYCVLGGYLAGCINPAYIIGKLHGMDVRTEGSHNAGASNTIILFGRKAGAGVMFFDILKAVLAVYIAGRFYPHSPYAKLLSGSACTLGHMFPVHMRFRGGKGMACLGGMILAYDWRLFLVFLALTALVAYLTDYVFLGALFAATAFPLLLGAYMGDWLAALCVAPASLGMFVRHTENFARLIKGQELGFSWLWKKDAYSFPKRGRAYEEAVRREKNLLPYEEEGQRKENLGA